MAAAAQIIDLAVYRQRRAETQIRPAIVAPSIVFVPMWTFVPVVLVAGYY